MDESSAHELSQAGAGAAHVLSQTGILEELTSQLGSASGAEMELSDSCLSCTVPRDKKTGSCRGFCFLEFLSLAQAETAVCKLNAGVQVAGQVISAQLSRQSGSAASVQHDRKKKDKAKAGYVEDQLPALRCKRQVYDKTGKSGPPPPVRKHGARIAAPVSSMQKARYHQPRQELCLTDAEPLLELQDRQLD
eukprot:TRINITY_DN28276_c0_g2_i1.p1 TRINITY_DN28276_c0_g2~~TRINITY_DN28276_c0_g2_i1.p1  ORF type:complete len:192 (-),score=37.32 TRINITY_DN28276_c0_g2_i1:110-685(-)